MPSAKDDVQGKKTTSLMLMQLGIWFCFAYAVCTFDIPFNNIVIPVLGFAHGLDMAAQASLLAFVVMPFVVARRHDRSTTRAALRKP